MEIFIVRVILVSTCIQPKAMKINLSGLIDVYRCVTTICLDKTKIMINPRTAVSL